MLWRICYDIVEVKLGQKEYAIAEQLLTGLRYIIIGVKGQEHLEVLQITLQLACAKFRMGEFEEAVQICQALLVQQQKRDTVTHDVITFTKAVLWLCDLQSGITDSEDCLRNELLVDLEHGSMPSPQLARQWEFMALFAEISGAVDVARVLKKHSDKAMELAFGIEYVQAMEKTEASPEDSNNGLVARMESLSIDGL